MNNRILVMLILLFDFFSALSFVAFSHNSLELLPMGRDGSYNIDQFVVFQFSCKHFFASKFG